MNMPSDPSRAHANGRRLIRRGAVGRIARLLGVIAALASPLAAHASFLPPEMLDAAAMYLAWFIIVVVPIAGIVLFWMVHVLPEKVAEKRHHPQKDAINVLCLLSLVFGGLLWPLAWLWAYTKPIGYRAAYGTDKHDDYFVKMADKAEAGEVGERELGHLRHELDSMAAQGPLPPDLRDAKARLDRASPAPEKATADGRVHTAGAE
jgi:hypothetical protein